MWKHKEDKAWKWGAADFHNVKQNFVNHSIKYAINNV